MAVYDIGETKGASSRLTLLRKGRTRDRGKRRKVYIIYSGRGPTMNCSGSLLSG